MAKYSRWFQWLAIPFVALAFHFYFGFRVIGRENIPEGGCVVCPNHCQNSDPPFAAVALGNRFPIRLMAKQELFSIKGLSPLITWLGAFPVNREIADIGAIKTALRSVRDGAKLIIFPQGTRSTDETTSKDGAAMLAIKTKAPVLPMYISENKGFRCKAFVVIGKPFYPEQNTKDYSAVSADIMHRIFALRDEVQR
jgi:1-acyl-sn-glycerol-3-phosphate acyltransferase